MQKILKLAVSVGEVSGDQRAAKVINALRQTGLGFEMRGMGGAALKAQGLKVVVDAEKSAGAMGFTELFGSIGAIFAAFAKMKELIRTWRPDVLLCVDYPDFNLRLAKFAKKFGCKVLYYSPPQVWAWRAGRVKLMQKVVDCAAVIFPFEREFYESCGYQRCVYVGHPFASEMSFPGETERAALAKKLAIDPLRKSVLLLPGSRRAEVERHWTIMREGFAIIQKKHPEVQGLVLRAPGIAAESLPLGNVAGLRLVEAQSQEVMSVVDAAILKSGTCNLEAAFAGLPFAMLYVASKVSETIVKCLVKLRQFSIVNIIRANTVVELLQNEANPAKFAAELERLLFDPEYCEQVRSGLGEVVARLQDYDRNEIFAGVDGASARVAKLLVGLTIG